VADSNKNLNGKGVELGVLLRLNVLFF